LNRALPPDSVVTARAGKSATEKTRQKILALIRSVPRGKVATYGSVGRAAGLRSGARLVARTLHTSVSLPWHRILGAGGEIKLRGDHAIEQRLRLESEQVIFRGRRVDMKRHQHKFAKRSRR